MQNEGHTIKTIVLGGTVTAFVLFGVNPSANIATSPITLVQYAWAEEVLDSAQDRKALEAVYHATGGDEWKNNDGWLSEEAFKDWYGLRVSDGRVVYLELDDNNLTGELPEEIGLLDRLFVLDLRWNSITSGLENLQNLSKLSELKLSANNFNGRIPESIGKLTNLHRLDLSENQFSGVIPIQIGALLRLETFAAHSNELTGEIPEELCYPHNLKRLVLSGNKLSGSFASLLVHCVSFATLKLGEQSI